jgi:hypothetical protein
MSHTAAQNELFVGRRIKVPLVTFEEMEEALRERLEALPPAARAELRHVFMLPDFDRADAIGTFWGHPETRTFGELLIDLEGTRRRGRWSSAC